MTGMVFEPGSLDEALAVIEQDRRLLPLRRATDEERQRVVGLPEVEFDNEEAIDEAAGSYLRGRVFVSCPSCGKTCRPLTSYKTTVFVESGWRWVGLAYKEPYETWLCRCAGCSSEYRLTTHTPQ